MPEELTIRLRYNLQTGKKDIYVDFVSEDDAMPIEHEKHHREIMAQLLGDGVLHPDEVGDLKVRRVAPNAAPATAQQQNQEEAQKSQN